MKYANNKQKTDKFGRHSGCCFYRRENKRIVCAALTEFYNHDDHYDQCGKCPFFKTEEEFIAGARIGVSIYDEFRA